MKSSSLEHDVSCFSFYVQFVDFSCVYVLMPCECRTRSRELSLTEMFGGCEPDFQGVSSTRTFVLLSLVLCVSLGWSEGRLVELVRNVLLQLLSVAGSP